MLEYLLYFTFYVITGVTFQIHLEVRNNFCLYNEGENNSSGHKLKLIVPAGHCFRMLWT